MFLSPYTGNFQAYLGRTNRALSSVSLSDYVSSTQYVDLMNGTARDLIAVLGGERSVPVQAAMDVWGNTRVPSLEDQPGYNPSNPHKWVETPRGETMTSYSSLRDNRVDGINRSVIGNTSFQSSSSYQKYAVSSNTPSRTAAISTDFSGIVCAVVTPGQHFATYNRTYMIDS
jgi:hypothetical protein